MNICKVIGIILMMPFLLMISSFVTVAPVYLIDILSNMNTLELLVRFVYTISILSLIYIIYNRHRINNK